MDIARGQRVKLADFLPNPEVFSLDVVIDAPGLSVDVSCFGLNAAEKLSDERYMTFFNQPVTPCGAVALESGSAARPYVATAI
jgi:tellurite resistance protein TerA